MMSLRKAVSLQLSKVVLLLLLLILVGIGTVPGYLSGKWRWTEPPKVVTLNKLRSLREVGLPLPGWQIVQQKTPQIGEHKWLSQEISRANQTATLLLFTQKGPREQPEVEWSDINGFQRWKTDSSKQVTFTIATPPTQVTAHFFRGWTADQTYAVLQWYATSQGGHPAPSHWFFADRIAQWQNRRVPWIAVSVLVPIDPLDDIQKHWTEVESLAQTVQSTLMADVLKPN
ncbi:cyanoexosortase B system-associated protein [Phormidesmis sp. 146-33]